MQHEDPWLTWENHSYALQAARDRAVQTGVRQAVKREDGQDKFGPYKFRIMHTAPAPEMVEPPC
jgi:hypothetical protein